MPASARSRRSRPSKGPRVLIDKLLQMRPIQTGEAGMEIRELAYLLVGAAETAAWRQFGQDVVGAMAHDGPDGSLYLKIDERDFRLAVLPGHDDGLLACGWLVGCEAHFETARARFAEDGVAINDGTPQGSHLRRVQNYFSFTDPAGITHEIAWGAISEFAPFTSPAGVSGFVTGRQGLGHVALAVGDEYDAELAFWDRPGRFAVSDILRVPGPAGMARVSFLHCANPRQHSMALGELAIPGHCIHIMFQANSIDDVGRCLDRAKRIGVSLTATLGRHVNDEMLSFYMRTPAGFSLEFGTGGREINDWSENVFFETTRGSDWGHAFTPA